MKKILGLLCVICLLPTAWAAEEVKLTGNQRLSELDVYEQYKRLFQSSRVFSNQEIQTIDKDIKSLALYRMGDRRNAKLSESTYSAIEQLIVEKLLNNSRLDIIECMECKTTKVTMAENRFSVLRRVESNDRLAAIGEKLNVDAFVLWDAYSTEGKIFFNAKIVKAKTGQFVWTREYYVNTEAPVVWAFHSSLWGIGGTRDVSGTVATVTQKKTLSSVLALGVRSIEESSMSEALTFGFGGDIFLNPGDRDYFDLTGIDLNARVTMDVDLLMNPGTKDYGNYLVYVGAGPALVKANPVLLLQGGMELRFNARNFMNLGFVYLQDREMSMVSANGYKDTANFGGFGYDISIGMRF